MKTSISLKKGKKGETDKLQHEAAAQSQRQNANANANPNG